MKEETAKAYMVGICKCLQSQAFPQEQQDMMMIVIIMVMACPQDT